MCGYFCIKFIDYMFDEKTLIDYTNLFSPHDFKKNDKIIKDIIINQKMFIKCFIKCIKFIKCLKNVY